MPLTTSAVIPFFNAASGSPAAAFVEEDPGPASVVGEGIDVLAQPASSAARVAEIRAEMRKLMRERIIKTTEHRKHG